MSPFRDHREATLVAGIVVVMAALLGGGAYVGLTNAGEALPAVSERDDESTFEQLLGLVPLNADTIQDVRLIDYGRAYEVMGVKPPPVNTAEELEAFQELVTAAAAARGVYYDVFVTRNWSMTYALDYAYPANIGYSVADLTGHVLSERPPTSFDDQPPQYQGFTGHFDPDAVNAAFRRCKGCGLEPEVHAHSGVEYGAWGGDGRRNLRFRLQPPSFDELGRGGRLVATDSHILRGRFHADIEAMIDASLDLERSLADTERFRLVARKLDEERVVFAHLTCTSYSLSYVTEAWAAEPSLTDGQRRTLVSDLTAAGPALLPYVLTGVGSGHENGESYKVIVLVHESREDAAENAKRVRQRLKHEAATHAGSEYGKYTSLDVKAEGTLVVAKLGGLQSFYRDDALGLLLVRED